jgi:hypothetical protein
MAMKRFMKAGWAIVAAAAVTMVWAFSPPLQNAHAQSTHTPWQHLTLSQLTAVWWQWAFSIPVSQSPWYDSTGAHAYSGQPYSDLLFLAGTFVLEPLANGDVVGEVTRSLSVKQGTAFFFPLLNTETDNTCGTPHLAGPCFEGHPYALGVPQLQAIVKAQQDIATGLYAMLTPTNKNFNTATGATANVGYARLQSPPFAFTLPATDNIYQSFGINVSGTVAPAVSDGYWAFIPGMLPAGYYRLEFGGQPQSVMGIFSQRRSPMTSP